MTHNYDYDEKLNKPNYRLHNRKRKRKREREGRRNIFDQNNFDC